MKLPGLFLILLWINLAGYAQNKDAGVFRIEQLAPQGVLLNQNWKFHPGDNPAWAEPYFEDSTWQAINPTEDVHSLPQLWQTNNGWFRLHFSVDSSLLSQLLVMTGSQTGASEIYLNGKLIKQLGKVSEHVEEVIAENLPSGSMIALPISIEPVQVIAVRFAVQKNIPYLRFANRPNHCLRLSINEVSAAANQARANSFTALEYFRTGLFFIISLLHLAFFCFYPAQRANFYFFLYTFFSAWLPMVNHLAYTVSSVEVKMYLFFWGTICFFLSFIFFLTAIYQLFNQKKGFIFWVLILLMVSYLPVSYVLDYGAGPFTILLYMAYSLEGGRIMLLALRRKQRGAKIIAVGGACLISFNLLFWAMVYGYVTAGPGLIYLHVSYNLSVLLFPIFMSFYLALEFALTSRSLNAKLLEVQQLSEKNIAQEKEKQQILISQNQTMEQQVSERTAELHQQKEELLATLEQLKTAQTKLKQLDAQKTRFFDNITHEFRTPLTLILAPTQRLLQQLTSPSPYYRDVQAVERNARHLMRLVNELLDLSKMEAGSLPVSETSGNIISFTEHIVKSFSTAAQEKQIMLGFQADTTTGEYRFDADKWEKIICNLLSNALKFTPSGGEIEVECHFKTSDLLQVRISDTGIGIAAEKLPFIFDRFYQVDDSRTRAYEGSGIGLALVRELLQLLGGQIEVKSSLGKGTSFILELPVKTALGQEAHGLANVDTSKVFLPILSKNNLPTYLEEPLNSKPLILVVEDNTELLTFIEQLLQTNYRVLTATNGVEGLAIACREMPEIVISDVMMPEMDGYALCEALKTDPQTDHIAVLLLTARSSQASRVEGLSLGADDYIAKPFHLEELGLRLHNLLDRQEKLREYYRRQWNVLGTAVSVPSAKDAFIEKLYALIEEKLDDPTLDPETLASEVAMSVRTLNRKLNTLIGISAAKLIRVYRLKRAAVLLKSGQGVSETAYQVGFDNPSYFATAFKEYFQKTPSEYVT